MTTPLSPREKTIQRGHALKEIRTPDQAAALMMLAVWGPTYAPPDWHEQAACRGTDPAMWFEDGPGVRTELVQRRRMVLCASCPVRDLCARDQDEWESQAVFGSPKDRHGVFGGFTPDQREEGWAAPTPADENDQDDDQDDDQGQGDGGTSPAAQSA